MPDTVTPFFKMVADSLESVGSLISDSWPLFVGDSPDHGVLMSGLAGMAAALGAALLLTLYFRRYRSGRDMVRHGLAAAAVLGLLACAVYDMRPAAQGYLVVGVSKPQAGLEIQHPKADTRIVGAI